MSTAPKITDLPTVGLEPAQLTRFLEAVREVMQTREGHRGNVLEKAVTFRDLVDAGILIAGPIPSAGGWGPAPTITDVYVPDYTAPPTPTGLDAVSSFKGIVITWDPPSYTQGHGNAYTNVYVAQYGGSGPLPVFGDAVLTGAAGSYTSMYVHPAAMSTQLHVWIKFVSQDGIESVAPAGGTNGAQMTVGLIGNADLGPLIVDAGKLATGAVDLSTNKVTASANYGAIAVGYTVTQYLVSTSGVMANLVVDNAQIVSLSAAKITTGVMAVGAYINSQSFSAGTTGWQLNSNGAAEFNTVTVRGAVYASSGTFAGSLSGATGTFAGALSAATGTFAGVLSAPTGTFGAVTIGDALTMNTSGHIKGGQSAYNTGTGFFLGYSGAAYKFSIGSGSSMLTWDGSTLSVPAITISGQVVTAQITDEAATVPRFASSSSATTFSTITTVLTAPSVNVGSAKALVMFSFVLDYFPYTLVTTEGVDDYESFYVTVTLKRDGTAVFTAVVSPPVAHARYAASLPACFVYQDTPGTGDIVYTLCLTAGGGSVAGGVSYRTIEVLGSKK